MEIQIREANVSDAGAIAKLNQESMGYCYPEEATAEKLRMLLGRKQDKLFVAVIENTVVGYIHANDYDLLYAPAMKNIMGLAVSPEYRRLGIGKALMSAVEVWTKETGAKGIRLVSGAGRQQAHAFYRDCGFSGGKEQLNFKKDLDVCSHEQD